METFEVMIKRGSTRRFTQNQIEEEMLEKILAAGQLAPIASKDYSRMCITVIQNATFLKKIGKTIGTYLGKPSVNPLYNAPTFIVISGKEYPMFDLGRNGIPQPGLEYANAGCIIENMTLMATDLGIGSVYLTGALYAFTLEAELFNQLGLPEGFRPVSGIALGYPQKPLPNRRKRSNIAIQTIK